MYRIVMLSCVFTLSCACLHAQTPAIPNYVPYENHGAYYINLQNLSVVLNVDLREKPGTLAFSAGLAGATGVISSDGVSNISSVSGISTAVSVNTVVPSSVSSVSNGLVSCLGGGQGTQYID